MTNITITPSPMERGFYEDEYELAVRDLEEQGHTVAFERALEQRGGLPQADLGIPYTVAVQLAEHVRDHALDLIADVFIARLIARRRGRHGRKVAIVGPTGLVLREVDLPEEDEDG